MIFWHFKAFKKKRRPHTYPFRIMMLLHSLLLTVIIYKGGKNPRGEWHWAKLKPTSMLAFNSDFFWLGNGCISFHIPLWKLLWAHHPIGWQGDLSLVKGNKKVLVSGTKTHNCISLLFLGYPKFICTEERHYSQISEKRRKARAKIEDFTENFSLDKQGTHFYLPKG